MPGAVPGRAGDPRAPRRAPLSPLSLRALPGAAGREDALMARGAFCFCAWLYPLGNERQATIWKDFGCSSS